MANNETTHWLIEAIFVAFDDDDRMKPKNRTLKKSNGNTCKTHEK